MIRFILKRLLYGFFVLLGVIVVVFFLFNVLPGDPARQMLGQRSDITTIKSIRKDLGLNKPLHMQLLMYINDVSPISFHEDTQANQEKYRYNKLVNFGDKNVMVAKTPYLRRSYQSRQRVSKILGDALPQTALLAVTSLFFATIVGIMFGVVSAIHKYSIRDHSLMVFAILGISTPSFFSSIIISWLFGFVLADITNLNMYGGLYDYNAMEGKVLELKNLILPAVTLGIRPLAIITQLTRSSMLDVLNMDYIRTARAKGVKDKLVLYKHALRNALNPVLTAVSGWLASLLGGAFFVEYIFNWNGIGKVTIDALNKSDFPVVMGAVLFISVVFVIINLLVDLLYGALDPRVRFD